MMKEGAKQRDVFIGASQMKNPFAQDKLFAAFA